MRRDQILSTSAKDFKAFAAALDAVRGPDARVVAVTSAERAAELNKDKGGAFWEVKRVM